MLRVAAVVSMKDCILREVEQGQAAAMLRLWLLVKIPAGLYPLILA